MSNRLSNINKKFLNIEKNGILANSVSTNQTTLDEDIQNISSLSKKYNYVKYLGKGEQGDLFLLNDNKKIIDLYVKRY